LEASAKSFCFKSVAIIRDKLSSCLPAISIEKLMHSSRWFFLSLLLWGFLTRGLLQVAISYSFWHQGKNNNDTISLAGCWVDWKWVGHLGLTLVPAVWHFMERVLGRKLTTHRLTTSVFPCKGGNFTNTTASVQTTDSIW
jgi:hypothetical protein